MADLRSMADLRLALERLSNAVARLELASEEHLPACRGERVALTAELTAAREEAARLSALTDKVSAGLDGAIDRIRTALEE